MKNNYKLIVAAIFIGATCMKAQTVSDFENVVLSPNSYYNGSTGGNGKNSGNAFFPCKWDTSFGGYWASGWAISNQQDSTTAPSNFSTQLYESKALTGYAGSSNYAIGTQGSVVRLTGAAAGGIVNGVYVTNTTYAYNSMKLGDSFAKKFGGTTGNDPDFFKLTIKRYYQGVLKTDSVEFYLADYRFTNNAQDYIVKTWQYVNLSTLGNADSLLFTLISSDNGSFGMNTPAYYAIDNFTTSNTAGIVSAHNSNSNLIVLNNQNQLIVSLTPETADEATLELFDINGNKVLENLIHTNTGSNEYNYDSSLLPKGIYFVRILGKHTVATQKFIIQ